MIQRRRWRGLPMERYGWPLEAEGRAEACWLPVGVRRRGAGGFGEVVREVGDRAGWRSLARTGECVPPPVGDLWLRRRSDFVSAAGRRSMAIDERW